jgi:hypothetical protein
MKKFFGILFLCLLFCNIGNAKLTKFTKDQIYEDEITWRNNLKVELPPGEFELAEKSHWMSWGIEIKDAWLFSLKDNVVSESVYVAHLGSWTYQSTVRQILHEILYMNKYDGCYPRGEYTTVKNKTKGAFSNCFKVRHQDLNKVLYAPDDPQSSGRGELKKHIKENNIVLPTIMLCSEHYFMSPIVTSGYLVVLEYCTNPDISYGEKNKFTTEERSEYHPANINQNPKKKKIMQQWIKLAAKRHKQFEANIKAKDKHKLDLSEYGAGEVNKKNKLKVKSSNLTNEIKELHELYKEGVLTKEEFEKAKNKLLN